MKPVNHRLRRGAPALAAGLVVVISGIGPPAVAQPSPVPDPVALGAAGRSLSFAPRTVTFQPRVVDLTPKKSNQGTSTSFTVGADVLFAFGSSALSPNTEAVLATVVNQLNPAPAGTALIQGFTDSLGTVSYNLTLSQQRAASVQSYLTAHITNAALTYQAQGLGEADPVALNTLANGQDNPPGRQLNRRVVITYTPS